MVLTQENILLQINKQMNAKVSLKKGCRKKIKRLLEKIQRKISRTFLSNSKVTVEQYHDTRFGYDTLGRDVESGITKYVQLLKGRSIKFHTIIVLGSRVKGRWKPTSDIDLTIIADNLPSKGTNAISKRIYALKIGAMFTDRPIFMGIEPSVCLSKDEYIARLSKFDVEALDAILYGQVVYDDGFWPTAQKKYENLREKYNLSETQLKELILPS